MADNKRIKATHHYMYNDVNIGPNSIKINFQISLSFLKFSFSTCSILFQSKTQKYIYLHFQCIEKLEKYYNIIFYPHYCVIQITLSLEINT